MPLGFSRLGRATAVMMAAVLPGGAGAGAGRGRLVPFLPTLTLLPTWGRSQMEGPRGHNAWWRALVPRHPRHRTRRLSALMAGRGAAVG